MKYIHDVTYDLKKKYMIIISLNFHVTFVWCPVVYLKFHWPKYELILFPYFRFPAACENTVRYNLPSKIMARPK